MKQMLPPTLLLICLLIMLALHLLLPLQTLIALPLDLIGLVPLILGIWLSSAGSHQFTVVGTNVNTFDEPDQLVTDGLYRFTRNPMYLGFIWILIGVWLLLGSLSPLLGVTVFTLLADRWYIPFEEHMLLDKFGSAFTQYKRQTRRWL